MKTNLNKVQRYRGRTKEVRLNLDLAYELQRIMADDEIRSRCKLVHRMLWLCVRLWEEESDGYNEFEKLERAFDVLDDYALAFGQSSKADATRAGGVPPGGGTREPLRPAVGGGVKKSR